MYSQSMRHFIHITFRIIIDLIQKYNTIKVSEATIFTAIKAGQKA